MKAFHAIAAAEAAQCRVRKWIVDSFGEANMDRRERALRLLEEAIELAQAEGIARLYVDRTAKAVYAKSPGEPEQEIGGVIVCALGWGAAVGVNVWSAGEAELTRIEAIPADKFRDRHRVKSDAGYAMPVHGGACRRAKISTAMADMLLRVPADWGEMPPDVSEANRTMWALVERDLIDHRWISKKGSPTGEYQWRTTWAGDRIKAGLRAARGL